MSQVEEYYALQVEYVKHDSGKALLVSVDPSDPTCEMVGADRLVWVPQSQILESSEVYQVGDSGELHVKMWWAQKKGWI